MGAPTDPERGIAAPFSTVQGAWWAWSDSRAISLAHRAGARALRVLPPAAGHRALRRWRLLLHRGDRVECPVCGARFRHFMARWNGINVVCWRCGSHERHRLLWLFLDRVRPDLLRGAGSLLHFAPEPGLEARLRDRVARYVTSDIDPDFGDLTLDITALDLPDESFDALICSHVLEHVPDDRRAMRELHRVLTPGGWAIVMVPIDHGLAETREDHGVQDPAERRRLFLQEDHVRLYALDVVDRLAAAGFEVQHLRPSDDLPEQERERYRLSLGNDVLLCRKPAAAQQSGR